MPPLSRKRVGIVLGSIFLVLVLGIAGGLVFLDSVLLKEARARAELVSHQIGRPISIGNVATKLLTGLSVRITGIQVGPAVNERSPLLELESAEVRADLLEAIRTRGKNIQIYSLNINGLNVNVVRFADGTTNLERLASKLEAEAEPKEANQGPQEAATSLSTFKLAQFRFSDGRIRFHDEAQGSQAQTGQDLEIKHLDLAMDNFEVGRSADLQIKAAVLADKQNAEVRLATAPVPTSLKPTLKQIIVKIQPIDLKPLSPYFPRSFGLREGTFAADFVSDLGAAIPGGSGETRVQGTIRANQLTFADGQGGGPLNVSVDTDIRGDAIKGDLRLDRMRVEIGPALITGQGKISGLSSAHPRIEGLELIGRDLDPAKIAELYPPLKRQLKGQISGPIGLAVHGSGTEAAQNVEIKIDLTPVRIAIPETLEKTAGSPMTLLAHLYGSAAGSLRFDVKADLLGVDLRPGKSLDKPPGQTFDLLFEGSKTASTHPSSPVKIELAKFIAHLRDSTVSGHGVVEQSGSGLSAKTQFDLAVESPRLNLDQLLLASAANKEAQSRQAAPPAKGLKKESAPTKASTFSGLKGHATVKVASLRKSNVEMTNVLAEVTLVEDELTIQTLSMNAFGGKLSANGTRIRLAHPEAPFSMAAHVEHLDVAKALTLATDRKVLSGTFDGEVNFTGKGTEPDDLMKALNGSLHGNLSDGQLLSKDLIASVSQPLAKALPAGLASFKGDPAGVTSLGKAVMLGVTVENGLAKLKTPLHLSRPEADLTLGGGMRLDGNLDLAGTIALAPETIASLTNGKVKPTGPIPIGLKVVGPAWKPSVTGLDFTAAVSTIAKQAATSAVGRLLGSKLGGKVDAQNPAQSTQEVVQQKAQQTEDAAKNSAQDAAKKTGEEVKQRLKGMFKR